MSVTETSSIRTVRPFPWLGLIMLASAVFLSVTGEMLPTGLLPDMSKTLDVSQPQVGMLVSIFAMTVVVTSAPIAALTRRLPRHTMIVLVIALLGVGNLLTSISPNYEIVVATRVLGGIAHGLFWSVGIAYAGHLVPKDQIGRAVSITLGGGTLALVFGVPIATVGGHAFGWRLSFALLGLLMLIGAGLVRKFLPVVHRPEAEKKRVKGVAAPRQRDATVPAVILACALAAIVMIGHYSFYTYIAPFMTDVMGVGAEWIGPMLFIYGTAGAIGLIVAGSVFGTKPQLGLVTGIVVTGAAVAALALFAAQPVLGFAAFLLWGMAFGALPPLLQTRMLHVASPEFRDTGSALYTTGFNVGIGGGAFVGAIVFEFVGLKDLPWVYVVVLGVALVLTIAAQRVAHSRT